MGKIKYTKELLEPIVKTSSSIKQIIESLGLVYCNGSITNITKALKRNNIDYNHLQKINFTWVKRTNEEIFCIESKIDKSTVKQRIIKNNLIEYKCHSCGCNDVWLGMKMPLILDHINGINNDNRLENLRFLCSNCDSIQPTYKNRNKNKNTTYSKKQKNFSNEAEKLEKNKLKNNSLIKIILESNIDFTKCGWRLKLSKLINKSPQYCGKYIEKNIPELWIKCKKHRVVD